MDKVVNEYCTLKENCRRHFMLRAIGSMEETPTSSTCCDVCSTRISIPIPLNFELLANDPPPRKRPRRATRKVDKAAEERLRQGLKAEREAYMKEHPSFQMLGENFMCDDAAIDKICQDARFISSAEDLHIVNIRPEVKSRFFAVIQRSFSVSSQQHTSSSLPQICI